MGTGSNELRVIPSHLRELSDKQTRAAKQISAATPLTVGEAARVQQTHGLVCNATYAAAQAAEKARARACAAMQTTSEAFAANLDTAAGKYEGTDQSGRDEIDAEMRPPTGESPGSGGMPSGSAPGGGNTPSGGAAPGAGAPTPPHVPASEPGAATTPGGAAGNVAAPSTAGPAGGSPAGTGGGMPGSTAGSAMGSTLGGLLGSPAGQAAQGMTKADDKESPEDLDDNEETAEEGPAEPGPAAAAGPTAGGGGVPSDVSTSSGEPVPDAPGVAPTDLAT